MQPGHFEIRLTVKALEAYNRSGGAMMEVPRSLALKKLEKEGLWTENDVVMLINYQGRMPLVPEVDEEGNPADTFTGLLYRALHQ